MEKITAYKYNDKLFATQEEVENYKIEQILIKIIWNRKYDIHSFLRDLANKQEFREEVRNAITPKAQILQEDKWKKCSNCRGSVGDSGRYCKNCGAKFVEVE